jgi:hypothetical protein
LRAKVDLFLHSVKREILCLDLCSNEIRTRAIRDAAHLAAGTDEGLEQDIIDACFSRRLHYEPAEEYADNVAKVIKEMLK